MHCSLGDVIEILHTACKACHSSHLSCYAEEEWPDANEIKAARVAAKEASTPIPERVWALRNVAGGAVGGRRVSLPQRFRIKALRIIKNCMEIWRNTQSKIEKRKWETARGRGRA